MRILALVVLLSATALAFTIINNCGASQDYVDALSSYLQQAYDMYSREVKTPALCHDFRVVLRNDIQYPALTYSRVGPVGACAYKMEFRCDISRAWLRHLAFHEMAHALQNAVGDGGKGYGWWSEAHAEGLASYYMVVRVYQAGQWQRYGWVQDFWDKQLYRQDPWQCVAPNLCAYQYGAYFAWLAWRYSPLNATLTYALPADRFRQAYWNFLLSPWSWGRDPTYLDFDECVGAQMSANSGVYCTYSPVLPNRVYVFSSAHLINATGLPDKILLALVATKTSTADTSVTVSYCPDATTTTVTQTVTATYTTTVTQTVTYTTTVTIPTTYTTTVTVPTTVTIPVTTTVPVTYTTTVLTTTTTTETHTVTVPITYTTTVTVPTVTTTTITATVPITYTTTKTETATVTVPITTTETVTTTVTEGGVSTTVLIIAIVVALLIGCYVCGRATAKTDLKTQEL